MGQLFCCCQIGETVQGIEHERLHVYQIFLDQIVNAKNKFLPYITQVNTLSYNTNLILFFQYITRYLPNIEQAEQSYQSDMAFLGQRPKDIVKLVAKTNVQLAIDIAFANLIGHVSKTHLDYHKATNEIKSCTAHMPRPSVEHTIGLLDMHKQAQIASAYNDFDRRIEFCRARQKNNIKVSDNIYIPI